MAHLLGFLIVISFKLAAGVAAAWLLMQLLGF